MIFQTSFCCNESRAEKRLPLTIILRVAVGASRSLRPVSEDTSRDFQTIGGGHVCIDDGLGVGVFGLACF